MSARQRWGAACMLLLAAIHALPLIGLKGSAALLQGYGLDALDPTTELLLRHRAVLFGLLAGGAAWSVWRPSLRLPMLVALAISDASFLCLAVRAEPLAAALQRVALADLVALLLVLFAALAWRSPPAAASTATGAQGEGRNA